MLLFPTKFVIQPENADSFVDEEPDAEASPAEAVEETAQTGTAEGAELQIVVPRPRYGFGGKPCLAMRDDGSRCGAIISRFNRQLEQICNACARRFAIRNQKPVFFIESYELKLR